MGFDQKLLAAHDALAHHGGSALHVVRLGEHFEHVVHARRFQEIDGHRTHHEGKSRRFLGGLLEQRAVIGADHAQIIGAPALHEAQIAGVIDDAGKIGVLVIDAHGEYMAAVADFAVEGDALIHWRSSSSSSPASRAQSRPRLTSTKISIHNRASRLVNSIRPPEKTIHNKDSIVAKTYPTIVIGFCSKSSA